MCSHQECAQSVLAMLLLAARSPCRMLILVWFVHLPSTSSGERGQDFNSQRSQLWRAKRSWTTYSCKQNERGGPWMVIFRFTSAVVTGLCIICEKEWCTSITASNLQKFWESYKTSYKHSTCVFHHIHQPCRCRKTNLVYGEVYAIANVTANSIWGNSGKSVYDKKMRLHLFSCFEAKMLIPFPSRWRSRRKTKTIVVYF